MSNNKPAHEIKLGRIKATIWKNETDKGDRYNATLTRLYRVEPAEGDTKDSGWRESSSFGRDDLLLVAKVADLVHSWIYEQNGSVASDEA